MTAWTIVSAAVVAALLGCVWAQHRWPTSRVAEAVPLYMIILIGTAPWWRGMLGPPPLGDQAWADAAWFLACAAVARLVRVETSTRDLGDMRDRVREVERLGGVIERAVESLADDPDFAREVREAIRSEYIEAARRKAAAAAAKTPASALQRVLGLEVEP